MLNASNKARSSDTVVTAAETPKKTPRGIETPGVATPRMSTKTPISPREKTGMGRELEMAFINASPWNSSIPTKTTDDQRTLTPQASDLVTPTSRTKAIQHPTEFSPTKSSTLVRSSRKLLPDPSRPAPAFPLRVPPLQLQAIDSDTPPQSPKKLSSPRKVSRAISEKFTSVKKTVEAMNSPRSEMREIFDGITWEELSEIDNDAYTKSPHPPLARSPLSEPSLKRKSESELKRDNKKVRFNNDEDKKISPNIQSVPAPECTPSSSKISEIDRLSWELAKSPTSFAYSDDVGHAVGESLRPEKRAEFQSPIHLNLPITKAGEAQPLRDSSKAIFPFAPNALARHAIDSRLQGKPWIGKATGDSVAGNQQRLLENLMKANAKKINTSVYLCLQQLFGLLPAGATEQDKTFDLALEQSLTNLGLTHTQWNEIEKLYRDFDQLDGSGNPKSNAELKNLLGKLIIIKNKLLSENVSKASDI